MTDRLLELEERVEKLEGAVRGLERRLLPPDPQTPEEAERSGAPEPAGAAGTLAGGVALSGRSFLVLGGAFLIRAATEAGAVSRGAGAAAGLAYAGVWLAFAFRDGRKGRAASAAFHAATAAGIAYPLLWEACERFRLLSPAGAAGSVAAASAALLLLSLLSSAAPLAWAAVIGGTSTLGALVASNGAIGPAAAAMILISASTFGVAEARGWRGPRALAAAGADLAMLACLAGAAKVPAATGIAVSLALPVVCFAGMVAPALVRRGSVSSFEGVQAGVSLLLGFGAAISAAGSSVPAVRALGAAEAGAGIAAYVASVRWRGRARNFHFFASAALAMLLAGGAFWMPGKTLSLFWSALAVGVSLLAARHRGSTFRWHAAAYVGAAGLASGLFAFVGAALAGRAAGAAPPLVLCVLAASLGSLAVLTASRSVGEEPLAAVPIFFLGTAALLGLAAVAAGLLSDAGRFGEGGIAALRTGLLAAASVAAALLGRGRRTRELGWLVYPLLAAGGIKLAVEDVPRGSPLTLFLGFAVFGSALLLAPRIARSGRQRPRGRAEPALPGR